MKRGRLRFGLILLLSLLLIAGCTRAKSSPAEPTATGGSGPTATQPAGAEATATTGGSAQDNIAATTTAWAMETAAAQEATPGTAATARPTEADATTATPAPAEATAAPATTETPEATAAPEATAEDYPTALPEPAPGEVRTHTVQTGENLFRIALSYGLSYDTLAGYNGIANPNFVYVGQVLKIPPTGAPGTPVEPPPGGGVHVVQPGENLFRIALQYNMTYTELAEANGLTYPYAIFVGQELIIP